MGPATRAPACQANLPPSCPGCRGLSLPPSLRSGRGSTVSVAGFRAVRRGVGRAPWLSWWWSGGSQLWPKTGPQGPLYHGSRMGMKRGALGEGWAAEGLTPKASVSFGGGVCCAPSSLGPWVASTFQAEWGTGSLPPQAPASHFVPPGGS